MGRIKTTEIKRTARKLVELYPEKFSENFEENKQILNNLGIARTKQLRNKIAGYLVRLIKQKNLHEKEVIA